MTINEKTLTWLAINIYHELFITWFMKTIWAEIIHRNETNHTRC